MNLLKISLLASILLLCQQSLAGICVNTSANHEMYRGADIVLVNGYDMPFRDSNFSDYQLFSANTNMELVTQIQKMTADSCSIVLGLFTSRECLIAGSVLKKNKAIGMSPVCAHDDVNNFFPYLYTLAAPISKEAAIIVAHLKQSSNVGKILAIYQPANLYSMAQFSEFKKRFTNPMIEIPVRLDGQFDLNAFSYNKNENITLIFFTYPLPSVKILVELSNRKLITKHTKVIGASSWNDDISVLKPIKSILENASEVIALDELDWKKVKHSAFTEMFIKKFNREPLNVEILNYDITRFAVKCYKAAAVSGKYKIDLFRQCLTNTKYQGVSGDFSFNHDSPFADHPLYFTNLFDRM